VGALIYSGFNYYNLSCKTNYYNVNLNTQTIIFQNLFALKDCVYQKKNELTRFSRSKIFVKLLDLWEERKRASLAERRPPSLPRLGVQYL
jgi:hypothetical protein